MAEEIHNYVAPIAVIPRQSLQAAKIAELRRKLNRTRKKEAKDLIQIDINRAEQQLEDWRIANGR